MDQNIPDEVRAAMGAPEQERGERVAAFSVTIARLRDDAVQARRESGIETVWMQAEEAYLAVDDENRAEFSGARWAKPTSMDTGLIKVTNSSDGVRSTAFVRLTSRYVDAGAAKVGEIALPVDGKPFSMKPTPVPELVAGMEDERVIADPATGQPVMSAPEKDKPAKPLTVADLAKHMQAKADKSAEKAAKRIHDWMVEYGHTAEMRKIIFDGARIGTGVIKGPVPDVTTTRAIQRNGSEILVDVVEKVVPVAKWVDPWNVYPSRDCLEDLQKCDYVVEKDQISESSLEALIGQPGYITEQIEACIAEGPGGNRDDTGNPAEKSAQYRAKSLYPMWHFYGSINRKDLEATNPKAALKLDEKVRRVSAIVTMIGDRAIKVAVNPIKSRRIPYHTFRWRRRAGHWTGVGVAEQVRLPQRIVNSATRAMLNNGGKSAGSIIVIDQDMLVPLDGSWAMTPDKYFGKKPNATMDDVRKAFASFQIPNMTPQLMAIVEYGFKLAEESSNIPLITQGQSGDTTPDTFGGQQLQDNNANQLLRDVGFSLADGITNPLVDGMYEWLLLDPDVPADEKGDHRVDTSGALAMIEKALQDLTIIQLQPLVENPAFGLNPRRWAESLLRVKRMNPADFQNTAEEQEQIDSAEPPAAPAVEAAKIRAEAQVKVAESRDALTAERNKADIDRDIAYNESLNTREENNQAARIRELELKVRLAELEYAKDERISLQEAKTRLADTTIKVNAQRELAGVDGKGPQVATPPTEPPGQAPNGEAYQR